MDDNKVYVQDKDGKPRDYDVVKQSFDERMAKELAADIQPCTEQFFYDCYSKLYSEAYGREFTEKLDDKELTKGEALDMDRRYLAYRRMDVRVDAMKDMLENLPDHPDKSFFKDYFKAREGSRFPHTLEAKDEFRVATEVVLQQLSNLNEVEYVAQKAERYLPFVEMQQYPDISPSGSYLQDVFVNAMEEASHRNLHRVADQLFDYISLDRKDMQKAYPAPDFRVETVHMSSTYPNWKNPVRPYLVVPEDGHWESFPRVQHQKWVMEDKKLRIHRTNFAIFDTRNHSSIIYEEPLPIKNSSRAQFPMLYHLRFTMPEISDKPLATFEAYDKEGLRECMREADQLHEKWMEVSKRCTDLHDIINTLSDAKTAGKPIDFEKLPFKGEGFEREKFTSLMPSEENKFFQHLTEAYHEKEQQHLAKPLLERVFFLNPRTSEPSDELFVKTAGKCLMDNMMQADVEDLLKKFMPQTVFGESFAEKAFEKAVNSPKVQKAIGDAPRGRED